MKKIITFGVVFSLLFLGSCGIDTTPENNTPKNINKNIKETNIKKEVEKHTSLIPKNTKIEKSIVKELNIEELKSLINQKLKKKEISEKNIIKITQLIEEMYNNGYIFRVSLKFNKIGFEKSHSKIDYKYDYLLLDYINSKYIEDILATENGIEFILDKDHFSIIKIKKGNKEKDINTNIVEIVKKR